MINRKDIYGNPADRLWDLQTNVWDGDRAREAYANVHIQSLYDAIRDGLLSALWPIDQVIKAGLSHDIYHTGVH